MAVAHHHRPNRARGLLPRALVGVAALVVCGCASREDPALAGLQAEQIDYNWHVRPILSENCFRCHGPDPSSRKAGLRLDDGELAVRELPETPGKFAIVRGDADSSELMRRVTSTDV